MARTVLLANLDDYGVVCIQVKVQVFLGSGQHQFNLVTSRVTVGQAFHEANLRRVGVLINRFINVPLLVHFELNSLLSRDDDVWCIELHNQRLILAFL